MMRHATAAAMLALVSGCAQMEWLKPDMEPATRDQDLARCEQQARASAARMSASRGRVDTQRDRRPGRNRVRSNAASICAERLGARKRLAHILHARPGVPSAAGTIGWRALSRAQAPGVLYADRARPSVPAAAGAHQITSSRAAPRTSISYSRPTTGGRAKCQDRPPAAAPRAAISGPTSAPMSCTE
jgi:hypothetical protein